MSLGLPEHLEEKISPEPNSGCWLWTAATTRGYAVFGFRVKNQIYQKRAHRYIYEMLKGEVPDHLVLDHKCKVLCCVNPDHLEPVTQGENVRRSIIATRKTCMRGHPCTDENTQYRPNGTKYCKVCQNRNQRMRYAKSSSSPAG